MAEGRQFDGVIDCLIITNARLFSQNAGKKVSVTEAGTGSSHPRHFKIRPL